MTTINKKIYIYLFFFIVIFSVVFNLINISTIKTNPGGNYQSYLVHDSTVWSTDNPWYTTQIKNYLNGDGFTIDPSDPIMSVRRTPGYPLFYGMHYMLFGEEGAHKVIPYTQAIIFALSAVAIGLIVTIVTRSVIAGYISTLFYGVSIFFIGFLSYTITEGIHPSIVVFSLYFLTQYFFGVNKHSFKYLTLAVVFCALAVLVRPTNGILFVTIIISILVDNQVLVQQKIKSAIYATLIFGLIFAPWILHNYIKVEKFIPLEAYYEDEPFGGWGSKHTALINWWLSWGNPDALALHSDMSADLGSSDRYLTIRKFTDTVVPEYTYVGYSKQDLYSALVLYQDCIDTRLKKYNAVTTEEDIKIGREKWGIGINAIDLMRTKWGELPPKCESNVSLLFSQFENKLKRGDPLRYYFIAPILIRGSEYIFHSFTSAIAFLNPINAKYNNVQYFIKALFYVINVILWIAAVVYLFTKRSVVEKLLFGSFILISFVFLVYYRWVEARYMLAAYPFMYIILAILFSHFKLEK